MRTGTADLSGGAVGETTTRRSFVAGARRLTIATLAVGLLNYAYSLGLTHLLDVREFAVFGAGQALLLSAGTISSTAVPWVLAKALVKAETQHERQQAIWFAVVTNTVLGVAAGAVAFGLTLRFAPTPAALVCGGAIALVFLSSTTVGLLQGESRFGLLGSLRVADAATKLVLGTALVLLGAGATGALSAFAAGSTLLILAAVVLAGRDLRPTAGALRLRHLWVSAVGVAGVQGLVSVLITADLVLVAVLADDAAEAATYQASMILSRVPLFLAGAVSASVFPALSRAPGTGVDLVRTAARLYLGLVLPFSVALSLIAPSVLGLIFPPEYDDIVRLLPLTAAAGLLIGAVELLTTFLQARSAYTASIRAQAAGLVIHLSALYVGEAQAGVIGLAVGAVIGSLATALLLLGLAVPGEWRRAVRPGAALLLGCGAAGALLWVLRSSPTYWFATAVLFGLSAVWRTSKLQVGEPATVPTTGPTTGQPADGGSGPEARRLRILHLAFEDWRKPGSGGGAVRTREVDRRLARRHDVTVLVSRYRGAEQRVEEGVRWVPVGLPLGYWGGMLSYFAFLPFAARRHRADLVVEDFAAPIGSLLPWRWTRRPLVAVVQWLDAKGKASQYHLPFDRIQSRGVRGHRHFVAMSEDLAAELRSGNPSAEVTVIPNGVPPAAFDVREARGDDVVFLGRLETAQKGLDLLVDAFARCADSLPGRLVIAGDGPDRRAVQQLVSRRGLTDRVVFLGRVEGADKLRLLASARVVAMPSRYETFGIVAAEALACGTPVVAFAIPSLREVVAPGTGVLVPAFDVPAFAEALVRVACAPEAVAAMGRRGRERARAYDWDDIAQRQEAVYLRAMEQARSSADAR